jgi:hypothetical protein
MCSETPSRCPARQVRAPIALQSVALDAREQSNCTYYRLLVPEQQVFDIYHDTVSDLWVLDMVQD